jgi:hypothetical protein
MASGQVQFRQPVAMCHVSTGCQVISESWYEFARLNTDSQGHGVFSGKRGRMIPLKGKRAKIERDFAKALALEVANAGSLSYRAAAARLRRLERSFLPMLPAKSADALEVRRRIAEQIYHQALSHGCSPAVCRAKLRALSRLGFTDVERKAHFFLLDARAALSRGDKSLARRTAATMIRELEDAPRRGRNPLRKELLGLTKDLLRQAGDPGAMEAVP